MSQHSLYQERYRKLRDLGKGGFGRVHVAKDLTTNVDVAIKQIPLAKVDDYAETEVLNHRVMFHPHIIRFQEALVAVCDGKFGFGAGVSTISKVYLTQTDLAIVMEYANGGDMLTYINEKQGLLEHEARWFFQQLVLAVDYCHRKGVVNRDIKLENTLVHWNCNNIALLKLCDFGYSKSTVFQSDCHSRVGTPHYLAPEVITVARGQSYDGRKSDVWSCGVMLYAMLVGSYPFDSRDKGANKAARTEDVLWKISHAQYSIPDDVQLSEESKDLLAHLFVKDPTKRYDISDILRHPWVLKDMPTRAMDMNDKYVNMTLTKVQSAEDISKVFAQARRATGRGTAPSADRLQWFESLIRQEETHA